MNVTEAIAAAKDYVKIIYADEQVSNLGLEEVEYDGGLERWNITIGFSRPWNTPRTSAAAGLVSIGVMSPLKRSYKVVSVSKNGEVISLKNQPREEVAE